MTKTTTEFKIGNFKKKFPYGNECPCLEIGINGRKAHKLHRGKASHVRHGTTHVMCCANHLVNYVSGGYKVIGNGEVL